MQIKNKKAQALIAAIIIVVVLALLSVIAASLLGTQTGQSAAGLVQSTQAFHLAHAGLEWYLQQLADDTNWADEVDQSGLTLGLGTFDIDIDESATLNSTAIDNITVTGKVIGSDGRVRERYAKVNVRKLPSALRFAVYWGRNTGSWLQLRNYTTINGDLWSRGTTQVQAGSSVTGTAYCPDNEDITGSGTFTEAKIDSPYPSMPQIDETYYNNLINTANSYITTYGTSSDITLSTSVNLTGGFYGYRNITTTGNITISGNGFVIASRNINLHSTDPASGTLTISPSGGNIYFLAGRNLTVNSTNNDTNVIINGDANNKVYLYSQDSNNNCLVRIRKNPSTATNVDSAFIIGERRIIVEAGAQVTNSTLYVSDVTDANNYLQITDSGTSVSGSIISVSDRDPGLIIISGALIRGFVYHWGGTTGRTRLDSVAITGSVVVSQYRNDRIVSSTITYDPAFLPAIPPEGFEGYVLIDPNSWDGL